MPTVSAPSVNPRALGRLAALAFGIGFSGALAPGPMLTLTIAQSARRGIWAGPLITLGHGVLEAALVLGLAAGLAGLVTRRQVVGSISLVGGSALLWMGWGLVRPGGIEVSFGHGSQAAALSAHDVGALVLLGVVVSVSNPYWSVWWGTTGLSQMTGALALGGTGVAVFLLGHVSADLVWYSAVSAAVAKGRVLLTANVYRGVLIGCGLFLLAVGVMYLLNGVRVFARGNHTGAG